MIVAKGETITDVEAFLTGDAERPQVDLSLPFRDATDKDRAGEAGARK